MQDKYVQKGYIKVEQAAANDLSFAELETGVAMFEKVAWLIHRILWYPSTPLAAELLTGADYFNFALTGSNKMTSLSLSDQAVYDLMTLQGWVSGTPASGAILQTPIIRDFSTLPGKGLLIPPRPIYLAIHSYGCANGHVVSCRIEFTYVTLKADEFWELVEATRLVE